MVNRWRDIGRRRRIDELADGYPIDDDDPDVVTADGWTSTANNEKQQVHFMQVFAICKVV